MGMWGLNGKFYILVAHKKKIMGRFSSTLIFCFLVFLSIQAQKSSSSWSGVFSGNIEGTPSTLQINANGTGLSGNIDAGGYKYVLKGTINEKNASGTINDPQTGGQLQFEASLAGETIDLVIFSQSPGFGNPQRLSLRFTKGETAQSLPGNAPAGDGYQRDQRLVGLWSYTESYTSGEYSFASEWKMQVNADGTYLYGDGRVIGGGPGVSGDSGGGGNVSTGKWRTDGKVIYIDEGQGWQAYAQYYIEGASMMFTFGNGKRQVWQRRG